MEHIAAQTANPSHSSATLSTVCLTVSSLIRSAKRRASLARCCQNWGSLTSGAMSMERTLTPQLRKRHVVTGEEPFSLTEHAPFSLTGWNLSQPKTEKARLSLNLRGGAYGWPR